MDRLTSFCNMAHVVSKLWFLKKGGGRVVNESLKLDIRIRIRGSVKQSKSLRGGLAKSQGPPITHV